MTLEWTVLEDDGSTLVRRAGDLAGAAAQVRACPVVDDRDRVCQGRFVELLGSHHDALDRTCRPGHLTASALVVEPASLRVLVLWHNKAQRWLQPGGHADGDGNLAHVALREATEETGIAGLRVVAPAVHLDIHEFRPPDEDAHLHFDVRYVIVAPDGAQPRHNHESSEVRWVDAAELPALGADPGLITLAERGLQVAAALR